MTGKMLIAGVGNTFLGDDGFGVAVANRLSGADLPDWVHVEDYGIRGMHLAYDLAGGYDTLILIDATPRGGDPGTIYVIEPERPEPAAGTEAPVMSPLFDAHGMQPDAVFGMLGTLGAEAGKLLVVGCEPVSVEYGIGLSEPVAAAVDQAVEAVLRLLADAAGQRASGNE